jgi:hypothetical protein
VPPALTPGGLRMIMATSTTDFAQLGQASNGSYW